MAFEVIERQSVHLCFPLDIFRLFVLTVRPFAVWSVIISHNCFVVGKSGRRRDNDRFLSFITKNNAMYIHLFPHWPRVVRIPMTKVQKIRTHNIIKIHKNNSHRRRWPVLSVRAYRMIFIRCRQSSFQKKNKSTSAPRHPTPQKSLPFTESHTESSYSYTKIIMYDGIMCIKIGIFIYLN